MTEPLAWKLLYDLKLGGFEDCASAWEKIADNLEDELGDLDSGLDKLDAALGALADNPLYSPGREAALNEGTDLRDRLGDAGVEADAVHQVLSDALEDLKDVRGQFRDKVDAIEGTAGPWDGSGNYHVDFDAQIVRAPSSPPDYPDDQIDDLGDSWEAACAGDIETFEKGLNDLAREAGEIDADTAGWLANNSTNKTDFNGEAINEVPSVQEAQDAADEVLEAAEDGVLTDDEIDEVNELLEEYEENPYFAEHLMTGLGPDGLVNMVGGTTFASGDNAPDSDAVNEMYEHLGTTLATATDPSNEPHVDSEWIDGLMEQGASQVTVANPDDPDEPYVQYGYQALAPLLPHGKFDSSFIVPVTEHMLALDAQDGDVMWDGVGIAANPHLAADDPINVNPLNAGLIALDNNPDAAADFFGKTTNSEQYPGAIGDEPVDAVADPLQYLLDNANHPDLDTGIDPALLGNSLEAATTGLTAGTDPGDSPPKHTEEMAGITRRLIEHVAGDPSAFEGPNSRLGAMTDNFANVTLSYIEDIYGAYVHGGADNAWVPDSWGAPLGIAGIHEGDANPVLNEWLQVIGHDQDALSKVTGGMEAVTTQALSAAAMMTDGNAMNAAGAFGKISAELINGMWEGIRTETFAESNNDSIDMANEGTKYLIGKIPGGSELMLVGGGWVDSLYDLAKDDPEADAAEVAGKLADKTKEELAEELDEWIDQAFEAAGVDENEQGEWKDIVTENFYSTYADTLYRPFKD
ncbi:MAG: hypothetical protein ACRDXX_03460 [Stackebrandtia sp.]